MNSTIPIMDPHSAASAGGSPGISDSASFSETLCTALSNEHRAHNATKSVLLQQNMRCVELEEQLNKSKQQVASMSVTIRNLGAIIKHNASKQCSEDTESYNPTDHSSELEEAALKEFYREYNRLKKAAKEREGQMEEEANEQKQNDSTDRNAAGALVAAAADSVDDTYLYNLDLLQKPDPENSADSVLRRTLRKHFSIDSSADDGSIPVTPSKTRGSLKRLVDISPESINGIKGSSDLPSNIQNTSGGLTSTRIRLLVSTGCCCSSQSD